MQPTTAIRQLGAYVDPMVSPNNSKPSTQVTNVDLQFKKLMREAKEAGEGGNLLRKADLALEAATLVDKKNPNDLGNLKVLLTLYLMAIKANPNCKYAADEAKNLNAQIQKLEGKMA